MRKLVLATAGAILLSLCNVLADDEPPFTSSDSPSITTEGHGTLTLLPATSGNGSIGMFTPITPRKTCSGECDGNSVGSWTCPDNLSCALDCTQKPPRKYCLKL